MKRSTLLFFALITVTIGCTKTDDPVDAQPKTVSDVLTETASFSLLRAAVQQAGMSDALKATNLTLFAPTDDAFKAKGYTTPESFNALSADALRSLIRYHLVTGVVTTKTPEVSSASNLPVEAANKSVLFLTNSTTGLFVNGSKVTKADQSVANGVIHTINTLLTSPNGDALTTLKNRTDVGLLVAALTRGAASRPELMSILSGTTTNAAYRTVTLFAPTDAAFVAAGYRTLADINAASPATLANLLSYHIVPGMVFSNQLQAGQLTTLSTATTTKLTVAVTAAGPTIKGNSNTAATPIKVADLISKNAVIHLIDQVLQP
ncbi:fasciclin domain-containing protein [Fibrella arboris]|uniref:fasciclin domain-containing protein n=1 Tax=Fibrella arboris TaxID=3242486 RepID=UPI0035209BD6